MLRYLLISFLMLSICSSLYAQQGIRGLVTDAKNQPVGFVTIYCKEQTKSTNSNADGSYELRLPAGTHQVYFQSVGYKTKMIAVTVSDGYTQAPVTLEEIAYDLKEVNIKSGGTNPAVWIMRKAIAAAPYYKRQVLTYQTRVYIKGSGKLDEIPFLFEKLLKKDGIEEGKTFLIESINDLSFSQPNTYKEKAISVKSSLPVEGAPQPMSMLRGSMYNTSSTELISPLSPQAFSVYNFKLIGSYYEDGREINRIQVIPKRKGQDVLQGTIYIIEGLWCLHSTDLTNTGGGFETHIITSFRPVAGTTFVWMPVTYDISVKGGFLGFKGAFRYLASASNYQIKLNPNLDHKWVQNQTKGQVVVIPTVKQEEEKPTPTVVKPKTKRQEDIEQLLAKEELSKMEMLKLANKMKLESEAEQNKSPEITPDSSTLEVDSLADKRDSSFWNENRPVALMESEVVSYKHADSVAVAKVKDSTSRSHNDSSFNWIGIVTGNQKTFNKGKNRFTWSGLIGEGSQLFLNTVDGWGATVSWSLGSKRDNSKEWKFTNRIRIPIERPAINATGRLEYRYAPHKLGNIAVEGGSYVSDFNATGGPSFFVSNVMLLVDRRNLLKLYQHEYIKIEHQIELTNGLVWKFEMGYSNRYQLWNINRFATKETVDGKITPNTPVAGYTMQTHQAFYVSNTFTYTPYQRYRMERGQKRYVPSKWPTFKLSVRNGIPTILKSDVDYMSMSFGITEKIKPLHWVAINLSFNHQWFVYNQSSYFPDYLQAVGNRSPVFTGEPLTVFRQLDYYQFSNTSRLTSFHTAFDFKRLLVKRLPLVNMTSIHEEVFYNLLIPPGAPVYQELGYGLTELFGFARVDVFAGFKGSQYNNWGIRAVFNLQGFE